jgi:hypothetical protein
MNQDPLEAAIQRDIEAALGTEPDLILLRNSVGLARFTSRTSGRCYAVPYGLGSGSPDVVGILRVRRLGVWFALEVKRPGDDAEAHQAKCHEQWRQFGALVYVVHSVEEARAALEHARGEAAA